MGLGFDQITAHEAVLQNRGGVGGHPRCVLSVAFPFAAVSRDPIGGAEQIVAHLDQAITRNGGTSLVFACEGSAVSGTLIPVPATTGTVTKAKQARLWEECRVRLEQTLNRYPVDLIHFHGIDFFQYLPATKVPKLVTLHLPPSWYPANVFSWPEEAKVFLHCVSHSQHQSCPPSNCLLPPIENGVFVSSELPRIAKSDFVLSLGRICPEKGFHLALEAAKQAEVKMFLAGEVFEYEAHQRYFETEIAPRLDGNRQFIGPVRGEVKRRLLSQARCVLISSLVPETSSLVAMEALACGTPVVAFRNGALPEIVEQDCTGFLVQTQNEMAAAIEAAGLISRERCWAFARSRLCLERMTSRYLERYRFLIEKCSCPQ